MNENKYTTLEQSKRLAKAFGDKAPEADGYWFYTDEYGAIPFSYDDHQPYKWCFISKDTYDCQYGEEDPAEALGDEYFNNFRLDTLRLELPEWREGFDTYYSPVVLAGFNYPVEKGHYVVRANGLLKTALFGRGKEAIAATVSLLELFYAEGIGKSEGLNE